MCYDVRTVRRDATHCMILESPNLLKTFLPGASPVGTTNPNNQMIKRLKNETDRELVQRMYSLWLDTLCVRNNNPYGSARYNRAEAKCEEVENQASLLVFNDTKHTMTQCVYGEDPEDPAE